MRTNHANTPQETWMQWPFMHSPQIPRVPSVSPDRQGALEGRWGEKTCVPTDCIKIAYFCKVYKDIWALGPLPCTWGRRRREILNLSLISFIVNPGLKSGNARRAAKARSPVGWLTWCLGWGADLLRSVARGGGRSQIIRIHMWLDLADEWRGVWGTKTSKCLYLWVD